MAYQTFLGKTFDSENDEELSRSFGDVYHFFKKKYPWLQYLPREEFSNIYQVYKQSPYGDTFEKSVDRTEDYIKQSYPIWNMKYINMEEPEEEPEAEPQSMTEALEKSAIASQKRDLDSAMKSFEEDQLVSRFYDHLKDDKIEGYYTHMYCDSVGKPTVGAGLQITGPKMLKNMTMTRQNAPVSPTNPAMTDKEKQEYWDTQQKYCNSFYKKNKETGKYAWKSISAEAQEDDFTDKTKQPLAYFQDDELKERTTNYIRNTTLPTVRKNFKNIGLDFDNMLNTDGKIANMDLMYNLGENKFKLGNGSVKKGYWPNYTKALQANDFATAAKESHRDKINKDRNDEIYNLMLNGQKRF